MSRLKIKQIQDILVSGPSNGDFLAYNSNTGNWENNAAPLDGAKGDQGGQGDTGEKGGTGEKGDTG